MFKNILGFEITKPEQQLIILRGLPSSGKSTKALELVGSDGVIHSTDDVISSMGDYNEIFSLMNETKDFSLLFKAHNINYENVINSINKSVKIVIVDNTHIKPSEPKKIVMKALELGLNDKNIRIVDIGLNGLTAEDLFKRNKHNVSLDKIKSMLDSYRTIGELTLEKIIKSKDMVKLTSVLYSAVILDTESINEIFYKNYPIEIPDGWLMDKDLKYFCDHMTINLGELKDKSLLGKEIKLVVTHIGISDMAIALKVNGFEIKNNSPHITLAINNNGGRPKMSNNITEWIEIKSFTVSGTISEIDKYKNKLFCDIIKGKKLI